MDVIPVARLGAFVLGHSNPLTFFVVIKPSALLAKVVESCVNIAWKAAQSFAAFGAKYPVGMVIRNMSFGGPMITYLAQQRLIVVLHLSSLLASQVPCDACGMLNGAAGLVAGFQHCNA